MLMASLPVGLHHNSSSYNFGWMLDHIVHMQRPSLHVGLFMTLQVTTVNECCITYFTCKCLHSMWVAPWLFNWQLWLNVRSHISHANSFSSCWAACWLWAEGLFKLQMWLNVRWPNLHAYSFTPMWVASLLSKWQLWLNVRSPISHANGFTPCGSLHDSSSDNCGWMLHHIFHMQMPSLHVGLFMTLQVTIMNEWCITYFSCKWLHSMWVATWLLNWQLWLNVRSHILHANGFTPCGSLHDS